MGAVGQSLPGTQYNPYANNYGGAAGATSYNPQGAFQTPLQPLYHQYYPHGPALVISRHTKDAQKFRLNCYDTKHFWEITNNSGLCKTIKYDNEPR